MKPTSVKGIRRMISRKLRNNKPVPPWMHQELEQAIKEQGNNPKALDKIVEEQALKERPWLRKSSARLQGFPGAKYGKASPGRTLTQAEMEQRKQKLESNP